MSEANEKEFRAAFAVHRELLAGLPGGTSLLAEYEDVPDFHDATVENVALSTRGKSLLRLANPYPTIADLGLMLVTFEIDTIVDASLDFFGNNILSSLKLRHPADRAERRASSVQAIEPSDIEFELDSTLGLSGFLVGRGVSVRWKKDRLARRLSRSTPSGAPELPGP